MNSSPHLTLSPIEVERATTQRRAQPGRWGAAARIPGRMEAARGPDAGRERAALETVVQQQQAQLEQLSGALEELRRRMEEQGGDESSTVV